jgi:TRAP transporter TAXI family solute receptor
MMPAAGRSGGGASGFPAKTIHNLEGMMRMNSIPTLIAAALFFCGLTFAGGNAAMGAAANLVMGTASVSGTWYPVGGALCASMSKADGVSVNVQTSGGGVENLRTVSSGDRDIGMSMYSLGVYAMEGVEAFKGTKLDNIRGIAVFMPIAAQFAVRDGGGIKSIADLKGKRIGIGAPGSGEEVCVREILDANGLSYADVDERLISFSEQVTAFKDRQLDAMFIITTAPTSGYLDVSSQAKITILPITGEEREKVIAKYPHYYRDSISASAYEFLSGDVDSVGIGTLLFTNAEMDADIVYKITKAMFDDAEHLKSVHEALKGLSPEFSIANMGKIKLHPGAERYYREIGLIK